MMSDLEYHPPIGVKVCAANNKRDMYKWMEICGTALTPDN